MHVPVDEALQEKLCFPVGRFQAPEKMDRESLNLAVAILAALPARLAKALDGLEEDQLNTPYRSGGWTVRQLVHHIADSHMNAFTRVRLALTEEQPTIRPYDQDAWGKLADSATAPTAWSVQLLESLHARWVYTLQHLSAEQWDRTFVHPEQEKPISITLATFTYAWHSRHHVAHITHLRNRMDW